MPRRQQPDRVLDAELARQVASDLRYIRDTWGAEQIDDDTLRRDSAILRRLVIDNGGGLLRTYRKQLGHRGDIKVDAVDLTHQLEGLDRRLVKFATAGGATHNRVQVSGGLMYGAAYTDQQVKQRYERGLKIAHMGLARYLDSTCVVADGVSVSRRALIKYISNRLGGVHYDTSRDANTEKSFLALDTLLGAVQIAQKDLVYFELLAIGQTLIASADLAEIIS